MQQTPFDDPLSQPTLAASAVPDEATREQWEKSWHSGANWFYWIAGLSLVNTALFLFGSDRAFIFGLGATQVVELLARAIAAEGGDAAYLFAFLINGAIVALVLLFGFLANRGKTWAFGVGMTLYALDAGVFLLASDWLGLGFHVFVLYCMAVGWSAAVRIGRAPAPLPGGFATPAV